MDLSTTRLCPRAQIKDRGSLNAKDEKKRHNFLTKIYDGRRATADLLYNNKLRYNSPVRVCTLGICPP